jgi:hypothetical protein
VLDRDDRLESTGFDMSGEGGHPSGIGGDPGGDGCYDGEFHGSPRLLRRIISRHASRVLPVCCVHTRTGDSSSIGNGSSVGAAVTVGLGTGPAFSDQIDSLVVCSVEQYAVAPSAVVAVLPTGEQLAPTTATGGFTGSGGGGRGVNAVLVTVGDSAVAMGGSDRSARRNSMTATVIAATSRTARTAGTMTPDRSSERFGSVAAGASGADVSGRRRVEVVDQRAGEVGAALETVLRILGKRLGQHRIERG